MKLANSSLNELVTKEKTKFKITYMIILLRVKDKTISKFPGLCDQVPGNAGQQDLVPVHA